MGSVGCCKRPGVACNKMIDTSAIKCYHKRNSEENRGFRDHAGPFVFSGPLPLKAQALPGLTVGAYEIACPH